MRIRSLVVLWMLTVSRFVVADADPPPAGSFTLVVLPDTQYYTDAESRHEVFIRQTQWIAEHVETHNIRYVLHVGDVVQNNNVP
jgi:hypothetical protein